ncbi:cell surface protein, partial [Burkholderia cenocepacia]|nr:cell surface protein [Burkholderia cenocepacia]
STSTSTGINSLSTGLSTVSTKTDNLGSSTASALGGGSTYDPTTGKVSAPSYTTYNANGTTSTANSVGSAINNINSQGIKYFHANSTGADSTATGTDAVAIGSGAVASTINSVAIGLGAVASTDDSVALGADSKTVAATPTSSATVNGVTFSGFAGAKPVGVVSVGDAGKERQVTNVAAGQVTSTSTDAINGSQLYSVAQQVGTATSAISSLSTSTSTGL